MSKKYRVSVPFACWVTVEVEAESKEKAIEEASQEVYISSYCGNGGSDKLIGVYGDDISIYASDEPIDCPVFGFEIEVEEVE